MEMLRKKKSWINRNCTKRLRENRWNWEEDVEFPFIAEAMPIWFREILLVCLWASD